jgi:hypothetical protein
MEELDMAIRQLAHADAPSKRPMRTIVMAATLVVVFVGAVGLVGLAVEKNEVERLDAGTGNDREQQAIELAADHWDNPLLRVMTLDRVVLDSHAESDPGCREVEVGAVSFFGAVLDRVVVSCDDSVRSLTTR